MSRHTKAGRRASFRRWAKGWWLASGSDLVASRAESVRMVGATAQRLMERAILGAEPPRRLRPTPGHVGAVVHAEFFERHRVAFRAALAGEWVEISAPHGAGVGR